LFLLPALLAAWTVTGETRVCVVADRTNLRYQNADNVEIAAVVSAGQELTVHGPMEGYWLPVTPPEETHVWVYGELVRKGSVLRNNAQLRCGPGLGFKVIGSVNQGTAVESRGRSGDWLKIRPPPGLLLWVNHQAVRVLPTNAAPEITPLPSDLASGILSALQTPTNAVETGVTNPTPAAVPLPISVATNRAPSAPLPALLANLPLAPAYPQGRRMRFHGTLRPALRGGTAAPATHRLTYADRAGGLVTACQILPAGDAPGNTPAGRIVTLEGPAWWLKDEATPVVVPESFTIKQ
jgi:hypothetical protein